MGQPKQKILFAYPEMHVGGSTTSLLSLLNTLDYDKYDVDMILFRNRGEFLNDIPKTVNLLPQAGKYPPEDHSLPTKISKWATALFNGTLLRAVYCEFKYKKKLGINEQMWEFVQVGFSRKLDKEYDAAIGYLEGWSNIFVLNKVKARKKIGYLHVDIEDSPFIAAIDCRELGKADKIVSVSEKCLKNFRKHYISIADKGVCVENILSAQYVRSQATREIPDFTDGFPGLKLITVCRLSVYHKGLDRAVAAMRRLIGEGYEFKWYLIGEGADRIAIERMVSEAGLEDKFILLGKKTNPYPYFTKCDAYVMPSRYEGKPMAVTEAQILGLPIIVTNYASAAEQVYNNVDGLIVDNNDTDIYYGIKRILDEPSLLATFRENLQHRQLSNENDIHQFYNLLH